MTRHAARQYFVEQLVKYREIDCYWGAGRLVTRCVAVRIAAKPLPEGAVYIARYAYPFSADHFLRDLDDALVKSQHEAARSLVA